MWWRVLTTTSVVLTIAIRAVILANNVQRLRHNARMEKSRKERQRPKTYHQKPGSDGIILRGEDEIEVVETLHDPSWDQDYYRH